MIFPSKLQKNDTVLLAAPCSPLPPDQTPELVAEAVERLGFRVKIGASCRAETARGYSAAPAEVRARDINEGFADPAVDAIWCIRGGSTAWELPPLLDYDVIAANPKPFIGFSDVTTLHLAIQNRCGLVTFHGMVANRAPGWEENEFTWTSLWRALTMGDALAVENPPGEDIRPLRPGRASGALTGGNLSLVVQSLCTPWQVDAKGCILYLEDVGEGVYALDRMLSQLRYAGVLEDAAGLAFGPFTKCRNSYHPDYGPEELLREMFRDWPRPVIYNVRSGHCTPMAALPMGAVCEIDGDRGTMVFTR